MNEIQSKLLEIAKEYIKVCEKLNLRYFAIGGTALGAVRHHGFIPWDDDMDFAMPREDYETFIKEGQKYFPSKYFIQEHRTEKKYFYPFAKVRDSKTTAIENLTKNLKINHGLWIDVFPFDGLPSSIEERAKLQDKDHNVYRRRYLGNVWDYKDKKKNLINKFIMPTKSLAYKKSYKLSRLFKYEDSELIWWNWNDRAKTTFYKKWFDDYKLVNFENMQIRVPLFFDEYLTAHYGDWKKLPPKEQQISIHDICVLDLNKSYKDK